jgi:hypothetical protein
VRGGTYFSLPPQRKVGKRKRLTPLMLILSTEPQRPHAAISAAHPSGRIVVGSWVLVKGIGLSGFLLPRRRIADARKIRSKQKKKKNLKP